MKKTALNLIPSTKNPTPDYYCTWQTQLYATSDGKPAGQRAIIGERAMFDPKKPFGWAYFYEKAKEDLFFVMDDSWDVPLIDDRAYYGSLILNREKFPASTDGNKTNAEALKVLSDKMKSLGWKGLGGWVCAQESAMLAGGMTPEEYWTERLTDAKKAGFSYWKVDWGKKAGNIEFRRMLTALGKKIAPDLIIEHAVTKDIVPDADVFRTYDVPAILSIPMTMEKLREFSAVGKTAEDRMGLLNCEDEVYIAAAGGFSMGVMRHPYSGAFPNGKTDMSFPAVHRNLKTKMAEVLRAVRWHRIAPAFGVDAENTHVDEEHLQDTWQFIGTDEEIEAWWLDMPIIREHMAGDTVTISAPARIARNCALAEVSPDENGNVPYVVTSKNPSGAFSVATLGRTMGRTYQIPKCDVTVDIGGADTVGVFGEYKSLTLKKMPSDVKAVLMQDLADDTAYDITDSVDISAERLVIAGELIQKLGTIAQPAGDTSEAGAVIKLIY